MIIYCSKKLETFLGNVEMTTQSPPSSVFGDWNGHLIMLHGKKALLLVSNRTCYSLVTTGLLKKNVKDFGSFFRERLFKQLHHDLQLNEQQEMALRVDLTEIVLCKSNGDKRITTTINHLAGDLKHNYFGTTWDDLQATRTLNERPFATKLPITNRKFKKFFVAVDVVKDRLTHGQNLK